MFASFAFILKGTNGAVRSGCAYSIPFETNKFAFTMMLYPYFAK